MRKQYAIILPDVRLGLPRNVLGIGCLYHPPKQTSPVIIILRIEHNALAVDDVPILCDRHIDGGPALGVDQVDGLWHRVRIFPAVLHGLEAQASPVHVRVLRALVRRHLRKFLGELQEPRSYFESLIPM